MRKANELSDEQLFKCMKEYLDNPTRYHPKYLQLLMKDYERRVLERTTQHGGNPKNFIPDFEHTPPPPPIPNNQRQFANINTSQDI
jgi:hypothetical protein